MQERKHLVAIEVDRLLAATKGSRNATRDRCLLLLMYRHGLRVSEACGLKLSQVDVGSRILHVARLKKGLTARESIPRWGIGPQTRSTKKNLPLNSLSTKSGESHITIPFQ